MQANKKPSSFQSVILNLIREELNMMLCETFQLKQEVSFTDYHQLTKIILHEISKFHIVSPHLTPEKAKRYIKLLEHLDCHSEVERKFKNKNVYDRKWDNPYSNSPFF